MFGDCGTPQGDLSIPTVSYVRFRRYQIFDNAGRVWNKFLRPITVAENIINTGGSTIFGGGVWSPDTILSNAVFEDILTVGGFPISNSPATTLQQFYALSNGSPFAGGQVALQIKDRISFRPGVYGTLSILYEAHRVSINGDGNPPSSCQ